MALRSIIPLERETFDIWYFGESDASSWSRVHSYIRISLYIDDIFKRKSWFLDETVKFSEG